MIKSMTGYGSSRQVVNGREIFVELRSVNHRHIEFSVRLPREINFLEEKLKAEIKNKVFRGKIDVFVSVGADENEQTIVSINDSVASGYISALREFAVKYGLKDDISVSLLARYNDIFEVSKPEIDEELLWNDVKIVLNDALDKFVLMRETEGEKMLEDIHSHCENVLKLVEEVEKRSPKTVEEYYQRLLDKMNEILKEKSVDEQRIITEAGIFADKVAVDEETVRLRSHFNQFEKILNSEGSVGRKIDFLLQEMNREANTIGSKVQDAQLAHIVVEIKSELEKIREQIQNIE